MTVTFRHGDLGAATTDITAKVRQPGSKAVAWTLTEAAEKGSPAMSGFATEDPGSALTLVGLKEVHAEDTASADPTIFAGFFDSRHVGRAEARGLVVDIEREWDATTTDLNTLLGDHIIESGKRPAETDIERIDWLLASGYLPIGDAGYIDRSSPTSLPEQDYTGRFPADVLAECSNLSGQNYFVRWEQSCYIPDPNSPWIPPAGSGTTWVAPVPTHSPPIISSLDVLGGAYGGPPGPGGPGDNYVAAASVYPSTPSLTYGGHYAGPFGPGNQPDANTGAMFGFGLFVIMDGGMTADGQWVWDLSAAGLPRIATVGVNFCEPQLIAGYPASADWSVEASDDGTTWTTIFGPSDIAAVQSAGGAPLSVPAVHQGHRYWSLHMTLSFDPGPSPGFSDWASQTGGFLLWAALPGPGPALGYHAYNWSGDESGCAISNVLSEINGVTVFGPSPGDKLTRNPGRVYSGCWFEYSGGHVYVTNPSTEAAFRHRDVRSSDMNCQSAAAATALANAYLGRCAAEEDRITVNIDNVPASSLGMMRPGQRIPVHLSHVPDYTSWTYMAIMRRSVTALTPGRYKVQMELSNPVLTGFRGSMLSPSLWSQNIGQVVNPATVPADAISGQRVPPTFLAYGNGSTTLFTVSTAYIPGSLLVYVDGQPVPETSITETDPAAGTFTLDFAAAGAVGSVTAEAVAASWQVA